MAPLTLEIASSVIYPRSNSFNDGSVRIDITPPSPVHSGATPQDAKPSPLLSGPEHPLYRLPQSISSGGLKVHLNAYVPPKKTRTGQLGERPKRDSLHSTIDEDHIIFEVSKSSLGDAGADYVISNLRRDDGEGSYGRGHVVFTPGWIWGGTWIVEYNYKSAGQAQESRVDLQVVEGGREDGVWKMTFPMEGIVAREMPKPLDRFGENGRALEIVDGSPGLDGWSEAEWRDFLTACWITKVWNACTRTPWLTAIIREGEGRSLPRW